MDVLRRKTGRASAERVQGADRAFRLALARAARDEMALALDVASLRDDAVSLAELIEGLAELSLVTVLDLPESDALGLFALEPALLSAMIATLTTGRVAAATDSPRRPTRTDAAMVAPLVDATLAGMAGALAGQGDAAWADGWRYASFLADARPLALLLDDVAYRLLSAEVTLAEGAVSGRILLALPSDPPSRRCAATLPAVPDRDLRAFQAAFAQQVQSVTCRIDAELVRVSLPLSRILTLQAGEVLPLADASVAKLVLRGIDGRALAEGKLGQMRGQRAIRLGLPAPDLSVPDLLASALPSSDQPADPPRLAGRA